MPDLLTVAFSFETCSVLLDSHCILNDARKLNPLMRIHLYLQLCFFFFFYKQAKEWTPARKAKKENPAKKFYSESEEEEDSSDSSSDSGGVYNSLKKLCSLQFICCASNKTIRPSI